MKRGKMDSVEGIDKLERKSSLQNLFPEVVANRATIRDSGEEVAIKRIPGVLKDAQEARRALREVKLLKHFRDSPHVVNMLDVVKPPSDEIALSSLLLVFELMDTTLHTFIAQQKEGLDKAVRLGIAHQLMLGLRDIHSINVVHRDLRPKNLLLRNGKLKICDFGMARKVNLRMSLLCYTTCSAYCAPEGTIANNTTYTTASDMWSAGCILFEMITGRRMLMPQEPKARKTPVERLNEVLGLPTDEEMDAINVSRKHREEVERLRAGGASGGSLRELLGDVDDDEYELVSGLLQYDPSQRLSAEDALQLPVFASMEAEARSNADASRDDTPNWRTQPAREFPPFVHDEPARPLITDIQREMRHEIMSFPSHVANAMA